MESKVEDEYRRVVNYCKSHFVPEYMLRQSVAWEQGLWKPYWHLLGSVPFALKGTVALDFGCKYGHFLPLLIIKEVDQAVGIDVEDTYLEAGRMVFEKLYPQVRLIKSDQGYIPLQPESVDFVFANEVVSHINPGYLETFYAEIARILRPKGVVLISDGNNLESARCRRKLVSLYDAWENGPDGAKTDRDTVIESFRNKRAKMIRERYPDLDAPCVDYLAENTSGLFGDFLMRTVAEYIKTGELIRRPYHSGVSPTNPNDSGAVLERGLHPSQIKISFGSYGVRCRRIFPRPLFLKLGLKGFLKDAFVYARYRAKTALSHWFEKTRAEGFQMIGVKE